MADVEFTDTPSRLVGYVRVSTLDQETALQLKAMQVAGVVRIFEEKRSAVAHRPALDALLESLQPGDTVVVYKVDRLARSLSHLLGLLERIQAAGASFRSLTEPIETGTLLGRLMLQLLGSFAEFERGVIRERCHAGRVEARARGVRFGRPREFDREEAARLREAGLSWRSVARHLGKHESTVRLAMRGVS